MRHKALYILPVCLTILAAGCIKNDLPYPKIQQDILTIAVEGESAPATINANELTVTLHLAETTDPEKVRFTDFTYTDGAECSRNLLEGIYDLSEPLHLTLSLYQDYNWTINAEQTIERYFSVAGQIGETAIDVAGKRIVLYVSKTTDLHNLKVTGVKLGPEGITTLSPDLKAGDVIDASSPVTVRVSYFNMEQTWTLYVDTTDAIVTTTQADAWVNVLWIYGNAPENADNGFRYRRASDSEWITVQKEYITYNGGAFVARVPHLSPLTDYVVCAYSDENTGNEIEVTTGAAMDLPDAGFDVWWKNGNVWCPWAENGSSWWDTGNKGAATLGQSNVTPSDDTPTGIGQSAKLETKFVGIGAIGKLAAGSIYSGSFRKVDGTNGILDFGRPWNVRPTKLKGFYKFSNTDINYASEEFKDLMGRPDTCQIWIALTDMDSPCEIRTNPKNRQLFDRNAPGVIAYGEFARGVASDGWQPFEVELQYKATNRRPKYLLVVCAASKYGDYFTGGTGTTLYVDDLSLSYDY